jgi:hypothetical protein
MLLQPVTQVHLTVSAKPPCQRAAVGVEVLGGVVSVKELLKNSAVAVGKVASEFVGSVRSVKPKVKPLSGETLSRLTLSRQIEAHSSEPSQ